MGTLPALSLALLGTAIATTGVFLFVSRYRRGRSVGGWRLLRQGLIGGALLAGGLGLIVSASLRWPTAETPFDPNRVLAQAPPAAIPTPDADTRLRALARRHLVILAWGTPSDVDRASEEEEAAYSASLTALAGDLLGTDEPTLAITSNPLQRTAAEQLIEHANRYAAWCEGRNQALVLTIVVGARRVADTEGFAPWREPVLELYDCASGHGLGSSDRVEERRGDHIPYEQALRAQLQGLLERYAKTLGS